LIEVRLFGDLRRYASGSPAESGVVLHLPAGGNETVGQVLTQVGIRPEEVSNIFLNGRLLPRSIYPITLGYPLAADKPLTEEGYLATPVHSGDRLGVFPCKMGLVVV
jgi:hypothetical protein